MRRKKRVLIFPNTNTLSHLGRSFSIAGWLEESGCEVHTGISQSRMEWASGFHPHCHVIREMWEPSGISFPCLQWFSDSDYIEACVRSQEDLVRQIKPDLIIGIFDYISSMSSGSIPRLCLNGACMLPAYDGVLGFDDHESDERSRQKHLFDLFWSFSAKVFHESRKRRGQSLPVMPGELLEGDFNLIYEIPEISRLKRTPRNYCFIGPVVWDGWEKNGDKLPWHRDKDSPIVYLNCGTFRLEQSIMQSMIAGALNAGFRVLVSGCGNGSIVESSERLISWPFMAPSVATGLSDLVVCTGGTGVCYTNLLNAVPSLVVPMQPEQANNGLDIQAAGCGRVTVYNTAYLGHPGQFVKAAALLDFGTLLCDMLKDRALFNGLGKMQKSLRTCDTKALFLRQVEELV